MLVQKLLLEFSPIPPISTYVRVGTITLPSAPITLTISFSSGSILPSLTASFLATS